MTSKKYIKTLALFEFFFYGFLIYKRIELINVITSIDKAVRELINLSDYENGWSFIILLLLLISYVLTLKLTRVAWVMKQIGLICLFLTLGISLPFVGIITALLMIYYSLNKVSCQFKIANNEKIKFYSISVEGVAVILLGYLFIDILNY